MKIIVFLQNAYSPVYAGITWPRASWLRALAKSRSGKRLKTLIDDLELVHNTTQEVGALSKSICPPDLDHIKAVIAAEKPDLIVACGKQAAESLVKVWDGSLIVAPHPACRWMSKEFYEKIRGMIDETQAYDLLRVRVWQRKGEPITIKPFEGAKLWA